MTNIAEGRLGQVFCAFCGAEYATGHRPTCRLYLPTDAPPAPTGLWVSDAAAEEVYNYMINAYLDRNRWPQLSRLIDDIHEHLRIAERRIAELSR